MDDPNSVSLMHPSPEPGHALGNVADDWEAARVWLQAVARKSRNGSQATMATYGYHLAKLRWYCENVCGITLSRWSAQEVEGFYKFLEDLPDFALCGSIEGRFVAKGEASYTPFRTRPAKSSRADIRRFVQALFNAWNHMGYVRINPTGLSSASSSRKLRAERSLNEEVVDTAISTLTSVDANTFTVRQLQLRDVFILTALRDLGLRANELVGATMGAFYQLSDPATKNRYWIFLVTAETGKGGRERRLPVTRAVLAALMAYREAYGLPSVPVAGDPTPLLLSSRTCQVVIAGQCVKRVNDRRFFGAWRPIRTRQALYKIVKGRLGQVASQLRERSEPDLAAQLELASPHWLRHTFAKASLLKGQSMREVAGLLGHASVDTTMIYTEQDALDLARALERTSPGAVAIECVPVCRTNSGDASAPAIR